MNVDQNPTIRMIDYTESFNIQKSYRKIPGKAFFIPLRDGLYASDIKVFAAVIGVWLLTLNIILKPILDIVARFLGYSEFTGIPYLLALILPPIAAVLVSRRPLAHNLKLTQALHGWFLDITDDGVHHHGISSSRDRSPAQYRVEYWTGLPEVAATYATAAPPPADIRLPRPRRQPEPQPEPITGYVADVEEAWDTYELDTAQSVDRSTSADQAPEVLSLDAMRITIRQGAGT